MQQPGMVPPAMDITDDDKLWSLLSWIFAPLVPVIVLLLEDKKNRPFIKYNAINGLIVGGLVVALSGVTMGFGCFVLWIVGIYMIYAGIQAYKGVTVNVPFITDFAKKQNWL